MKLLIVESPAKCKTIGHYLGEGYLVESSIGHIRDLKIKGKGGFGVDIQNNFQPEYEILSDKKEIVEKLTAAANLAEHVYLATDPDREGEAISWHLSEVLNQPKEKVSRIVFNEITKTAVLKAISHDRDIDMDLVHSQESRRILDRIIGFRLSSLLQQKIGSKSAGRVQSVALKLVVDREKEIQAFDKVEFWDLSAIFSKKIGDNEYNLKAKFYGTNTEKINLPNEETTNEVIAKLDENNYVVSNITKKERNRASKPPFITSTLQQDASAKFNYNAKRVMSIAQKLYEGVELGKERVGLITYMRTDSLRLSDDALNGARDYIQQRWGDKYLPSEPRKYKSRSNAQDGHEAIRPTTIELSPDKVKDSLTPEQYKLYKIIWERFIACQMSDCIHKTTSAEILAGNYIFKASGYRVDFDGFTVLYVESKDTDEESEQELPPLKEGMELRVKTISPNQHFTQPPARYTEASLIKALEEYGIGRPSTYAATISTITSREYVKRESKTLIPTELGEVITKLMKERFPKIVNVKFTA